MAISKALGWGRQKPPRGAQLNYGHPLARGLIWFPIMNEGAKVQSDVDAGSGSMPYDIARWNNGVFSTAFAFHNIENVPGLFGRGLQFDGTGSFVKGRRTLNISGDTPVTLLVWINLTDVTTFSVPLFIGDAGTALAGFSLAVGGGVTPNVGSVQVEYYGGNEFSTAASAITTGRWYQLVAVKRTVGNISTTTELYINGVRQSFSTTSSGTFALANTVPMIGAFNLASPNGFMPGVMDHCRIYNRALSHQEILTLYREPFADVLAPHRRIIAQAGGGDLKAADGVLRANIKTMNGLAIGSVKTATGITAN